MLSQRNPCFSIVTYLVTEYPVCLDVKGRPAPQRKPKSWFIPTMMVGSFVLGIVFAGSHHAYCTGLDDTIVGSAARQQWPIRFGTAFALLTQVCLSNATTTAYIQWVWRRCRERGIQIRAIDAAFAVDRNILMFCHPSFPTEFRVVTLLAVIFRYVSISKDFYD